MERYYKQKAQDMIDANRISCPEKEEMKKVSNQVVVRRFMTMEGKGRKYDL